MSLLPVVAAMLTALAGCAGGPADAGTVPARTILADLHCGGDSPGVRRLADAAQWEALLRQIARRRPGSTAPGTGAPDFSRESVFVIEMGRRPSLGYSVSLAQREARLRDGRLEIRVVWEEPAPGMLQGQIVTSPCLVVGVPVEARAEVVVLDARERERVRENPR